MRATLRRRAVWTLGVLILLGITGFTAPGVAAESTSCVTQTPTQPVTATATSTATSTATTGPVTSLPATGEGPSDGASVSGMLVLLGGALLLMTGIFFTIRRPGRAQQD